MANVRLEYHHLAIREGREAVAWYEERSIQVADRFELAARSALAEIEEAPERWPLNSDGTRFRRIVGFPYLIIYRVLTAVRVRIIAITHSSRRPGYWSRRK